MTSMEPDEVRARPRASDISLAALLPYVFVRVACIGVFWVDGGVRAAAIFAGCFGVRMFALTVGYHRYFAHRAFRTSRPVQFILALLGSTCLQGGILWWAETHRRHHRHADTPHDLHSPAWQGFLYSHYGWFLDKGNRVPALDRIRDLARYPELVWLNRWHVVPAVLFMAGVTAAWGMTGLLWGALVPTVVMWEITHWVQSFSHAWGGYRRWPCADRSRNHWLLGVIALGEYHNNHHRFPSSPRQGCAWWEIDVGYYFIRLFGALGLVWDARVPSEMAAGKEKSR
jgi:stearoyl-CoA desaturase (delta-9 desaturase)